MTFEEITEAVKTASSPEEAAAIYFAVSIRDSIKFNKELEERFPDPPEIAELCTPTEYPAEEEIDALKRALIAHLPAGIQAYATHPVDMARRSGFALSTGFDPECLMDQLITLAGIAPDSSIKQFLPATTLRLLPTVVFSHQRLIWGEGN